MWVARPAFRAGMSRAGHHVRSPVMRRTCHLRMRVVIRRWPVAPREQGRLGVAQSADGLLEGAAEPAGHRSASVHFFITVRRYVILGAQRPDQLCVRLKNSVVNRASVSRITRECSARRVIEARKQLDTVKQKIKRTILGTAILSR